MTLKIRQMDRAHIRKRISFLLLILFCLNIPHWVTAQTWEPAPLEDVLTQVNIDSMLHTVKILSGELPATIQGQKVTIKSRNFAFPGNEEAAQWIESNMTRLGYTVQEDLFGETGHNIFSIKQGHSTPENVYIICAHYDSWPNENRAPGADDNASGVAVVMEAARIFSQFQNQSTVIFGFWDEEELGYYGAKHYIESYWSDEEPTAVLNLDMIAWDENGDDRVIINTNKWVPESEDLFVYINDLNTQYNIDLDLYEQKPRVNADQQVFWDVGINAVGFHEDVLDDANAYYHSPNDLIEHYNVPYYEKVARLGILSFASLSDLYQQSSVATTTQPTHFTLYQNYPNPFNATTNISFSLDTESNVEISIYDIQGSLIIQLAQSHFQSGLHTIPWHAEDQSSGIYLCQVKAGSQKETFKLLLQK